MATAVQEWMVKTMSDMAMKYEDWLRGCVHHDGRKGNVYLPCDMVLAIADWIEAHRDVAPVRHGRWRKIDDLFLDTLYRCSVCGEEFYIENGTPQENQYCYCPNCGARLDGEEDV